MKPLHRGLVVAALHCALVVSIAGKYAWDRDRLPRAWTRTAPLDPNLPVRGRYVRLRLAVDVAAPGQAAWYTLAAQNGRLVGTPAQARTGTSLWKTRDGGWALAEPVAFFIPEHVPDPSQRQPGEELWVEVSVPRRGPPRPLRLAVKRNGIMTPLNLR